jgi:hypothetical protein
VICPKSKPVRRSWSRETSSQSTRFVSRRPLTRQSKNSRYTWNAHTKSTGQCLLLRLLGRRAGRLGHPSWYTRRNHHGRSEQQYSGPQYRLCIQCWSLEYAHHAETRVQPADFQSSVLYHGSTLSSTDQGTDCPHELRILRSGKSC